MKIYTDKFCAEKPSQCRKCCRGPEMKFMVHYTANLSDWSTGLGFLFGH